METSTIIFTIVSVVAIILVIIGVSVMIYFKTKSKEKEIPHNCPIVTENFLTQFTDGYAVGLETNLREGDNVFFVDFVPIDVDTLKPIEDLKFNLVIDKRARIFTGKSLSLRRDMIKYYPRSEVELKGQLKKMPVYGDMIEESCIEKRLERTFVRAINKGQIASSNLVDKMNLGELSKKFIQRLEKALDVQKVLEEKINIEKENKDEK